MGDSVMQRFHEMQWQYATGDSKALHALEERIAAAGRRRQLPTYSGYISMRSYERARLFSSALVVSKMDGSPGDGFYTLLRELALIPNLKSAKALDLWAEHVAKAHTWYARN